VATTDLRLTRLELRHWENFARVDVALQRTLRFVEEKRNVILPGPPGVAAPTPYLLDPDPGRWCCDGDLSAGRAAQGFSGTKLSSGAGWICTASATQS
jgi:hypothetical protein